MLLLGSIISSVFALAIFGPPGLWVPIIALGLMAAHEAKRPGADFADAAAALLFLGVVTISSAAVILRISQQIGLL